VNRPTLPTPDFGIPIRLEGVEKRFSTGRTPISDLSLELKPGEFIAVLGPSGCGKTTLLRLIAGLETPSSGTVRLASGGDRPKLGYVFQEPSLVPWRSVLRNVLLPLELRKTPMEEALTVSRQTLNRVRLAGTEELFPEQLSGGMRMRVSLARALVTSPQLLLLDEPFASLDELTRFHLEEDLFQLWQDLKMTVVFVTHSLTEAAFLAQRAILLGNSRPGAVAEMAFSGPNERDFKYRSHPQYLTDLESLQREVYRLGKA
jgi:NitT/TauT family transport system ATP-binding protein